ncbi:MAG: hypothetical protein M3367_11540 [Acidobacteriota bacterium]|nr:hypothetical protein [Acidobacteriota bacterium]
MSVVLLKKVIEQVKSLAPEEQIKVRELLDSILPPKKNQPTREEYEQYLLAKGIITHIPTRQIPPTRRDFKPIKVEGEPISEMIIRERR